MPDELYRRFDPGKVIGGCDGAFEPTNLALQGPMRPGKTQEDIMPKESRPRYQRWLKTQK
jgi:hypothetical protein